MGIFSVSQTFLSCGLRGAVTRLLQHSLCLEQLQCLLLYIFWGLRIEIPGVSDYLIFLPCWSLFSQASHISVFSIFPHTLSSQVSKEGNLSLKPSDRTLNIFLTHTHFQSTFPPLSSVQSPEGMWCLGGWHLRKGNMEHFPELPDGDSGNSH